MKKQKINNLIIIIFISILNQSCFVGTIKEFGYDDLKWFKPYKKTHTIIFQSSNGELDTITFHKTDTTKYSVRNFEQGFYDEITLSVAYEFRNGSYHQSATMPDSSRKYDQAIFVISNSSSSKFTNREFSFIGIIYSGNNINNICKLDDKTYFFDRDKATYRQINVVKGIKNFTFNSDNGITEYTDIRDIKWTRK